MTTLSFVVPGVPVPKGRPRVVRGHTFTPKRTTAYEAKVSWAALVARRNATRSGIAWDLGAESFRVTLVVFAKDRRRTDVDNIEKGILDACNGILWNDDSQVDDLRTVRTVDKGNPRVVVLVKTATREDAFVEAIAAAVAA